MARQRRFEERWWGPLSKVALVSARVARDGDPVGWLYREAPDNETDSGWRVFAGDETQDYLDDDTNVVLVPLRDLVDRDPALQAALAAEAPRRVRTRSGRRPAPSGSTRTRRRLTSTPPPRSRPADLGSPSEGCLGVGRPASKHPMASEGQNL